MKNCFRRNTLARSARERVKLRVERPRHIIGVESAMWDLTTFSQQVLALMNDAEKLLIDAADASANAWSCEKVHATSGSKLARRSRPTARRPGMRRAR
ncbi:MAG: hypothetical protein VX589_13130 [Myxococcota bacterium]|nr:hypothetical protein [Myxococcota bacterium]